MKRKVQFLCSLLRSHKFEKTIAVDWTKTKTVPTPICVHCGIKNEGYDFNSEENKFYLEYWDLYKLEG